MEKGASDDLSKECEDNDLFEAIYSVNEKGFYFNEAVSKALLAGLKKEKSVHAAHSKLFLSPREIEVLKLLCIGNTNKEIAKILSIEPCTIDFHRRRLYFKTGTLNASSLAVYAAKNGLI